MDHESPNLDDHVAGVRVTVPPPRVAGWTTVLAALSLALLAAACAPGPGNEGSGETDGAGLRTPERVADVGDERAPADCQADAASLDPWPSGMPTFASGIGGWRLDHPFLGGLEASPDGSCIYVGLGGDVAVMALDADGLAHGVATVPVPGIASADGERILQLRRVGRMLYAVAGRFDPGHNAPLDLRLLQLDLADPARPVATGRSVDGLPKGRVHTFVADERWLYLGLADEIVLLDVRDPQRPARRGRIESEVANPRTVALSDTPGVFYGSYRSGKLGYVVTRVDARDPDDLDIRVLYEASKGVSSLAYAEGFLYGAVCFKDRDFFVLDLRDPEAPTPVPLDKADMPEILGCFELKLAMAGARLLMHSALADETYGALQAFDLSDPLRPMEVARAEAPGELLMSRLIGAERVLWFEWQRGLKLTTFGEGPRWSTRPAMVVPEPFVSIAVERDGEGDGDVEPARRWVAVGRDGLWTWRDVAPDDAPEQPIDWRRLPLPEPEGYVAPLGIRRPEEWPPSATPWRTVLHEDHAYVAADELGLRVIDLGDADGLLARPVARETLPPIDAMWDLALRDGVLYAADQGGLLAFDVRDAGRPRPLWREEDESVGGEHVRLIGPWAVILGRERRLRRGGAEDRRQAHITVYDIADPRRPRRAHVERLAADPIGAINWGGRLVVGLDPAPPLRTYAIAADGLLHELHEARPAPFPEEDAPPRSLQAGIDRGPNGLLLLYPDDGLFSIESPMAEEPARLMPGTAPGAAGRWWRARWLRSAGRVALLGELRTAVLRPPGW